MKKSRPKADKRTGRKRIPRIHRLKGTPDPLAELKAIKVIRTTNPRRTG